MEENKTATTTNATDGAIGEEGKSNEAQKDTTTATETTNDKAETGDEEFTDTKEKAKDNATLKDKPDEELTRRSEFAKQRREKEAQEKTQKEVEHKARLKAIKEERDGINPYTNQSMETDEDIEFYLEQKEMSKQGLDPNSNADYRKFRKQQTERVNKTVSQEDWVKNDSKDFTSKYPDVVFNDLFADKDFISYADKYHKDELGNSTPLSKIYGNYKTHQEEVKSIKENLEKELNDKFEKRLVKAQSVGSVTSSSNTNDDFFTMEQINKMSVDNIRKNMAKVDKSIAYWNKQKKK
jgi:hypothetical protein